jgi:hypothetical protein
MTMRTLVIALLLAQIPAPAAASDNAPGTSLRNLCSAESGRRDGREERRFECSLAPELASQRFRFAVTFSGSHDDTTLAMTATLNGSPIACDEGSKLESEGEFGDIVLHCRFGLRPGAGTQRLRVIVAWFHADLSEHQLVPD